MTAPTPFHDAVLDEATVAQLFFDIAHAAELVGVSQKGHGARRAEEPARPHGSLDAVYQAFVARRIAGVQLRYRIGGEEWWDTLTHTAHGVRLIRISHTRTLIAPSDLDCNTV